MPNSRHRHSRGGSRRSREGGNPVRTKERGAESTEQLAPLIDPNVHSCGTVRPHGHREPAHPEARFYAVGAKSYGRAPNFLLATGHEQIRSVVAALAGDMAAADDVQLDLPHTGVCSTQFDEASSGCCMTGEAEPVVAAQSVVVPAQAGTQSSCASPSCGGMLPLAPLVTALGDTNPSQSPNIIAIP